jgi:hypothetical protein
MFQITEVSDDVSDVSDVSDDDNNVDKVTDNKVKADKRSVTFDPNTKVHYIPSLMKASNELCGLQLLQQEVLKLQQVLRENDIAFDVEDHQKVQERIEQLDVEIDQKKQSLTKMKVLAAEIKFTCQKRLKILEGAFTNIPEDDSIYVFFVQKQKELDNELQRTVRVAKAENQGIFRT